MKSGFLAGICAGILVWPGSGISTAAETNSEVRFNRDIRPILSENCFKCHGPDLKKAGLNLQSKKSAFKELKSGSVAIVPGKSAASELIRRITSADENERMPPKGKGERLKSSVIAKLRDWIDQGAKWEEHWAYVKPLRPPLPQIKNRTWARNDIDYLVLARLEQEGLAPSPEAERATLIRRLSLDLTGLPPSIAEIDAFLADKSETAYEKVVDRLLASPHYGEHQARPWLDMARYADTNGYEKDDRRTIWPYRDWVIRAFNRDLPFDEFTIEQIAGDLLPNTTLNQRVATGFHRNTMVNTEGGTDDEEFRDAAIVDRVNTTMDVWMASTMQCAQCHNHKYDPFSQKEYYQFYAFFNGTEDRGRSNEPVVPVLTPEQEQRLARLASGIQDQQQRLNALIREVDAAQADWEKEADDGQVPAKIKEIVALPAAKRADNQKAELQNYFRGRFAPVVKQREDRLAKLRKEHAELQVQTTTLVMKELPKPRETHVHIRGNHTKKGDTVSLGTPAKLHSFRPEYPRNRLGLARWLVDPDNPLVGRVTMNRLWARYFGRGFVETSEEFGARGDTPTHPELLDWLATEFIRQKWSLKAMHKLIVMSATYRQSSRVSRELYQRDPYNRLFARGPRFRLDAEMVRDNSLAIGGLLSRKLGGPSVFPYQPDGVWFNPYSNDMWQVSTNGDQYRRGLYTFWRRTAPYAAFMAFDAPSREVCTERRPRTNTPLQALATLNDKAFVDCAAALARRVMTEMKGSDKDRAIHGFRLCVARTPTAPELDQLLLLYRENLKKYQADPAAAKVLAASGSSAPPQDVNVAQLAAWTVVANVLLNLDETITKG